MKYIYKNVLTYLLTYLLTYSLKRRFIRDKSFHEIYKVIVDDMLQKGYTRKAENKHVGKVCYIPYHGVTHPAKSGKS